MSRYNFAKNQASTIMPILIDSKSGLVKFNSLARLHQQLIALGFRYARKEEYGQGWLATVLRAGHAGVCSPCTHQDQGRGGGPSAGGCTHLSVAVTDGAGDLWMNERAKLTKSGKLETKVMTFGKSEVHPKGFDPSAKDFQGNDHYFVTILGGRYDGTGQQAWADRVHFAFPGDTDFSSASLP